MDKKNTLENTKYPLKCLVLSDGMLFRDEDAGRYYSFDTFPKFISIFSSFFEKTIFCVPLGENPKKDIFSLQGKDLAELEIVGTYPYFTKLDFYKKLPAILFRNGPIFRKVLEEADVVFMRQPCQNSFMLSLMARRKNKPLVCYFMGDEEEIVRQGHKYRGIGKAIALAFSRFHRVLYRKITRKAALSFFFSGDLRRKYGHEGENEHLIFSSLFGEEDIIPREDTCTNQRIEIIYVGRLAHEKGIGYLIRAVAGLKKSNLDAHLKICGDGPEKQALASLCEDLDLVDEVKFMGFLNAESLKQAYVDSDIFVIPSLSEGMPKVLIEAMAKALPVISTDVGGVSAIIDDGENGLLVSPKSPEEITQAVLRIVNDPVLRRKMIRNGLIFAKDHTGKKQAFGMASLIAEGIKRKEKSGNRGVAKNAKIE